MYWRVRKVTPEMLFKQYGVHVFLVISLFLNLILFVTRPKKETMTQEIQTNFKDFAKDVTTHLLDTSYITYLDSTRELHSELGPNVITKMKQSGLLPRTDQEYKAINLELQKSRQVCTLKFDRIEVGEPDPKRNMLVPVQVAGVIAIHSSKETSPSQPQPFSIQYWVGLNSKTKKPIVADFAEQPSG
ncbi:MAG: hypothetical protein R3C24_03715 [Cyanobacteriota/Melainabacteria group bacterium]